MSSVPTIFHHIDDVLVYSFFFLHTIKTLFLPLIRDLIPHRAVRRKRHRGPEPDASSPGGHAILSSRLRRLSPGDGG